MNYDVILNANDSTTLETQYAFTQGDYGQIQFSIRVKADGQYISNATRAYIVFSLSNGMIVTGADMQKSVATYTYVFQGNELQSPGKVVADVKLVYANGQISSNKFTFICRYDPLADKSVPAAPYITVLQRIVDEGQEKIDYLQALIDSIQGSVGGTPLTRDDLQNTRNPVSAGIKALDAHMAQYMLLKEDIVNQFLNDPNRPASAAIVNTINSNLTRLGTFDKIMDRTSNDTVASTITVSDMSAYRYILIVLWISASNRIISTSMVPYQIFHNQVFNLVYPLDVNEFSYVAVASNTQISIRNAGSAHTTTIYGIK